MVLFVLACIAGLVLLAVAADHFVLGATRLASLLRVSPVVIGAVVIGFGTSAPEMLVSGLAAAQGDTSLGLGNIIGSNIANLTLVLGVAALIVPMAISSTTLRREAPLSAAACGLFAVLVWNGFTRFDGIVLLVVLGLIIGYILVDARRGSDDELVAEVAEYLDGDPNVTPARESARTFVGLVGTIIGAQLLIYGAVNIATELELAEGFVGLTLVALGTSLPELVTAIAAARKGEDELIVGNLLGSNIFNSLAVGAVIALIAPGPLDNADLVRTGLVVMLAVVGAGWLFMATKRTVSRWEAGVLLVGYVAAIPILFGV